MTNITTPRRILCRQCLTYRDRADVAHVNSHPVCVTCVEQMQALVNLPVFAQIAHAYTAA